MAVTARVLYDFEGQEENGELTVKEGDLLNILNQDIGDGWWEGQHENGTPGLIPESYCELLDGEGGGVEPYGDGYNHDEWQDEWDDNEGQEEAGEDQEDATRSGGTEGGSSGSRAISPGNQSGSIAGRHGTVKKNINRFSPFVKSGTESFILGLTHLKREPKLNEIVKIVPSEEGVPMWEPAVEPFRVEVLNPKKQSKFKGIKTFISYEIKLSNSRDVVSRRYKHYDWLHDRLVNKFTFFSVPPLPDKQYYGRYGEDFVEKRREKLQMWTNRIARHPVISRSEVIYHFLHCHDTEEREWKAGKRKAEKDDMVGGNLYVALHPTVSMDMQQAEVTVEQFGRFLDSMEDNSLKMKAKFLDHCNKMSGPFMAEFHKMASVITGLGQCFKQENSDYAAPLSNAIDYTADVYREIGKLHAQQPKRDMIPTMDTLKEYLGLIQEFPDTVDIHRGAVSKVKDCERMKEEGRIDFMEASEITARSEKVSAVVMAEIYHFKQEAVVDFREMMKLMLHQQIQFYKEITGKLESALERYSESTDL